MKKLLMWLKPFLILAILIGWSIFAWDIAENSNRRTVQKLKKQVIEVKNESNMRGKALDYAITIGPENAKEKVYKLMKDKFKHMEPNDLIAIIN